MKTKELQNTNYTISVPSQYVDNANLYNLDTSSAGSVSLLGGVASLLGSVVTGIGNTIGGVVGLVNDRRANDNATALAQDSLASTATSSTTMWVCLALMAIIYFYFKK